MSSEHWMSMRGRQSLAACLALCCGAALAGAQESTKARAEAVKKAAPEGRLVYQASGGFAQVEDRMVLRPDGRLVASREFLGRFQEARAILRPEEVLGLMSRFEDWAKGRRAAGGFSEVTYQVSLVRGDQKSTVTTRKEDEYVRALRDLHRMALAGELAGPGDLEAALPIGPEGEMAGFTVKEHEIRYWHLTDGGQRVQDHRRALTTSEREAIGSALEESQNEIWVEPVDEESEASILPVDGGPKSTLARFEAVLRILRG